MNKIAYCLCFVFLLILSCEPPDQTNNIHNAYDFAEKLLQYNNSINDLYWSSISSDEMTWNEAVSYCKKLTEGGYHDWHLPTISELRTLIKNCPSNETGGSCGVTDYCLSYTCLTEDCKNDDCWDHEGLHTVLLSHGGMWSSSPVIAYPYDDNDAHVWIIYGGYITLWDTAIPKNATQEEYAVHTFEARCVRYK